MFNGESLFQPMYIALNELRCSIEVAVPPSWNAALVASKEPLKLTYGKTVKDWQTVTSRSFPMEVTWATMRSVIIMIEYFPPDTKDQPGKVSLLSQLQLMQVKDGKVVRNIAYPLLPLPPLISQESVEDRGSQTPVEIVDNSIPSPEEASQKC